MGSLFSFPLAAELGAMKKMPADPFGPQPRIFTEEEVYADRTCRLVHLALKHYNSNNPGAEFDYPVQSTTEMKAACVGFEEHGVWYHLGFSAHRRDNQEMHYFFAELCYHVYSRTITVETCTILEEPLCCYRSRCAWCPDETKILHPSDAEFTRGKEERQIKFFFGGHMLLVPFIPPNGNHGLSDGPMTDD